jgi:hypothetical protein
MAEEYLDYGVGSLLRNVNIKEVTKIEVKVPVRASNEDIINYTDAEKICLTVTDRGNKIFKISDAWVDKDGEPTIKGLWFTLSEDEKLSPSSSVAQLLKYYKVNTLKELIGLRVKVYPDENNYLVIVACDHKLIS